MRKFMDQDFLLSTPMARKLYHDYAKKMPILDYHCHISPEEIACDRHFENITEVWLEGDHYKWRLMRSNGVEERYITGDAPDYEKFLKWAETLERAIGNPLYHWSHLELRRYFGYDGVLSARTAEKVWKLCNEQLKKPDFGARGLILKSDVRLVCTTDDPADDLRWHRQLREDVSFPVQVLPTWRPEAAMKITEAGFGDYRNRLARAAGMEITSFEEMKEALTRRMDYFQELGCKVSDHSLDYAMYAPASPKEVEEIFARVIRGEAVTYEEGLKYQTAFLLFVGQEYVRRGWVMQLHFGVKRNNNQRIYNLLGADSGVDCINTYTPSAQLSDLLNALEEAKGLPRTILYSLNPSDNGAIGSIIGCFQNSECAGKIQQGSAWWFNDHKQGMTEQMTSLANFGILGNFIGMLTDSRSFLSYVRHEYFRRILCELIGRWVEEGEYPADESMLRDLVEGISYWNAVRYFGFDL